MEDRMDRIDELAIFVRIADEGSLAGAAVRLHRSPQAITRALAALEDRVGQRLIERTTRRFAVTEAGVALLDRARALLSEYDAATRRAATATVRGVVHATAPVQFGRRHLAPVIWAFLDQFPDVRVELTLHDRYLDLIEECIDLALRIGPLTDSGLSARRIGEVRQQWVAAPAYLARHGVPTSPGDLVAHQTIQSAGPGAPVWTFRPRHRGAPARLMSRLRVNDVEMQLAAARDGRGIARLLSYQIADDLGTGSLVLLLRAYEPAPLPVHLVSKGRTHRSPAVEALLDFAAARLPSLAVLQPR
jgi:DNA-binding transcriptional LysR family regulator